MDTRTAALDLPPLFRAIPLRELGDAFGHAQKIAATEGAGALVWVRRFDVAEFAVVLEPDEPLQGARRIFHAGMNALCDALAAHAPPERPVAIMWPDTIKLDTSIVGGGRLAWPAQAAENAVPDWIVFGGMVRLHGAAEIQPGIMGLGVSLFDAGYEEVDAALIIGSFARHFMAHVDSWQRDGFRHVGEHFCARLPFDEKQRHNIDINGDLLARPAGKTNPVARHALRPALERLPGWMDAQTGEPVL